MFRLSNKAERLAARYIPKDSEPIIVSDELTIYRYPITRAKGSNVCGVVVYWASAGRPTAHYTFRTLERANAYIDEWTDRLSLHRVEKLRKQSQKKAWTNPLAVGTIMYTSWGYDQTNVDFYVVTRVSGRRTWIRPIAAEYEATGFMSGNTWPAMPIKMCGDETMHTAQPLTGVDLGGVYLKIGHHHAWIETGRSHGCSSYA